MVTSINLRRYKLLTKEEMEWYCKGDSKHLKDSVNDDLESLFGNIRLGKERYDWVDTYFLPMLTEEELELIERRDKKFSQTFVWSLNPKRKAAMMFSKSDAKYVYGDSRRITFVIEHSEVITQPEYSSEKQSHIGLNCSLQ